MRPTRLSFPITKATPQDDGRLLVEGTATSDSIDSQDERLLYDGSVEALSKWLESGPAVRESHDPHKAVGRGLEMIPDPSSKSISVRVFVSKGAQDTQEKVLDGTLAAFSVGGQPRVWAMKKEGKKQIREISSWDMHELSLVDRPANPDCRIDVVKADQLTDIVGRGEEMAKKEQKPAPDAESEQSTPAPGDKPAEPNPPEKKAEEKPAEGEEPPAEGAEEPEAEEAEEPEAPPAERKAYASVKEAEEGVKADIEACNKEAEAFAASQASKRAAIAAAAEAFNLAAILPKEWGAKKAKKGDGSPEMQKDDSAAWDVQIGLDCLRGLQSLLGTETVENEGKPEQITLIQAAISALKAFIASEAAELLEGEVAPAPAAAPVEEVAAVAASAVPTMTKAEQMDKFAAIETSVANLSPELVGAVEEIRKSVIDEVKAQKRDLASIIERIDVLLAQPVPGGPRKMFAPGMAKSLAGGAPNDRVRLIEEWMATADPGLRARLQVELNHERAAAGLPLNG